jgi:predicted PhzF superfamily epimerase YddE/YHI9
MLDPALPVWVVDAFCEEPHLGNPAAVLLLDGDFPDASAMQEAAAQLAYPTLAVVTSGTERRPIRWFTPQSELNLCGHASIAAAAVLERVAPAGQVRFATREAGDLDCSLSADGCVTLDLPASFVAPCPVPPEAAAAIGAPVLGCVGSEDDLVYILADRAAVAAAAPDFPALARLPWRGHVITAPAGPGDDVDFVSRSFFPGLGVDEDQVCVSAHCKLAPYWAARLGRRDLSALQLSARGGALRIRSEGARVRITGAAPIRRRSTLAAEMAQAAAGLYRA